MGRGYGGWNGIAGAWAGEPWGVGVEGLEEQNSHHPKTPRARIFRLKVKCMPMSGENRIVCVCVCVFTFDSWRMRTAENNYYAPV